MADTTFEEAKRCPRCEVPGEETAKHPAEKGSTVYVFKCQTEGCKWHQTTWIVQVMRDGSIPIRQPGERQMPALKDYQKQKVRDNLRAHEEIMRRGELPH